MQKSRNTSSLTNLDISNWDMQNTISADYIVASCPKLQTINMSNCPTDTINTLILQLRMKENNFGKLYILNNKEHDLIDKATLDANNWRAVIYGGNIKAVDKLNGIFNSLALGNNIRIKHIHIGERFL